MTLLAQIKRIFHNEADDALSGTMDMIEELHKEFDETVTQVRSACKPCDRRERDITPIVERRRAHG